mmetsp:Transcript_130747/g.354831  ORF Transcript_130747/g.354831 Transcript_130747/m.354831 type:complete len:319 (-) Transcript_130747:105-1061(-)
MTRSWLAARSRARAISAIARSARCSASPCSSRAASSRRMPPSSARARSASSRACLSSCSFLMPSSCAPCHRSQAAMYSPATAPCPDGSESIRSRSKSVRCGSVNLSRRRQSSLVRRSSSSRSASSVLRRPSAPCRPACIRSSWEATAASARCWLWHMPLSRPSWSSTGKLCWRPRPAAICASGSARTKSAAAGPSARVTLPASASPQRCGTPSAEWPLPSARTRSGKLRSSRPERAPPTSARDSGKLHEHSGGTSISPRGPPAGGASLQKLSVTPQPPAPDATQTPGKDHSGEQDGDDGSEMKAARFCASSTTMTATT